MATRACATASRHTLTCQDNGVTRLVTTRAYDHLNRLTSIHSQAYTNATLGPLPFSYAYRYNRANQRTRMALADGSWWVYRYDQLGQVIPPRGVPRRDTAGWQPALQPVAWSSKRASS